MEFFCSMRYTATDIQDMQCWLFRKAQSKWNITPQKCAESFRKYDIFGYVSECYELLHVSSYESALHDIEEILKSNGEKI